jgi:large subunit ribosomal protein L1
MKRSKRYNEALAQIDRTKLYPAQEALELLLKLSTDDKTKTKFNSSIEMAINLNLKAKHTIRDTIVLPHSVVIKSTRILVFAKGDKATEAEEAGADYVGDDELIDKIKNENWFEFDVAIATPEMMKNVGKIGKLLGTRRLMPNPKTGTVTQDIKQTVEEFKRGKMEYRADKTGIIHNIVGRSSMSVDQVMENSKILFGEILKKKPADLKGEYVRSVAFSGAMTPGIKVSYQTLVG